MPKMRDEVNSNESKKNFVKNQPTLVGFESAFSKNLNAGNRWVALANKIPWDALVNVYQKQMNNSQTALLTFVAITIF